ncbi:peptidase M52 [Streptomyces sp. CC53]|uniref:hydrogenase maturation protease n=1 Tax=unclassified Streptomyces TaxID=2593676 RepID=UPI0008DDB6BB|nr:MULTISPECIES: hydrogenase maturation protease [unclassified Streptomyces]OII65847.1 peptidase M52 [Streptomyces sp. CC53]
MERSARVAVIGVGNDLRRDDGVGWAVVRTLRDRSAARPLPPDTVLSLSDGEPAGLIDLWTGTALTIVVDAVRGEPGEPGTVHRIEAADADLRAPGAVTSHGLGLGEAVALARALGRLPRRLCVYAVESADLTLGTGLSPAVGAAVAPLADRIEADILRGGTGGPPPAPPPAQ